MEAADPRIAGARRAVQPPSMILRPERPEDEAQITAVVRAAFRDHGPQVAAFAERIRASENYIRELALVATDHTGVIGHVMLSWVGIDGGAREGSSSSRRCRCGPTGSSRGSGGRWSRTCSHAPRR
jgi:hypothetical protein